MINPFYLFGFRRNEGRVFNGCFIVQRIKGVCYGQIVFACEIQIALIVCGTRENRARSIIHQNEISDPNGQFPIRV